MPVIQSPQRHRNDGPAPVRPLPAFTMDTGLVRRPLHAGRTAQGGRRCLSRACPQGAKVCLRWLRGSPCAGVNPPICGGNPWFLMRACARPGHTEPRTERHPHEGPPTRRSWTPASRD